MLLQKPAQGNIFAVQGPNFQRTDLGFAAIPAHALTCSLSSSELEGGDRQGEGSV